MRPSRRCVDNDEVVDYDFNRLGPLEFEHMIQDLAIAELGITVTTFGAGRDGGREATFKGRVVNPRDASLVNWDGYGIVQAKTIRFQSDESSDSKSIAGVVKTELDLFVGKNGEPAARKNPPRYYILATNVRLSPAEGNGGIDTVAKALTEHPVNLADFAIWHYEHLCRLLDKHDGIRRKFAGFVTPGDVLSLLMDVLGGSTKSLGPILRLNAARQIAAKESLKLETGEITETTKVHLSDIAIDLPSEDSRGHAVMTVKRILERGDHSLRNSHGLDEPYAFVVVGGPGQGKSTIGQIVAQAYRVALLQDATMSITPAIDRALTETRRRFEEMGLALPNNKRWPIVVDVAAFADALAQTPTLTVVEYAARQLRVQSSDVSTTQLASWLAIWPWVLVLDGLDEVPARSSREAVVNATNDLVTESRLNDWDLMIIGTTRPQGYENEFDELRPDQLRLKTLTPAEGLAYGKTIVETKLADNPEAIAAVVAHLEEASVQAHSSRLMTTPLQVSIMEFLLEELAEVPTTRHELFDGYYRAIFARESKKAGYLGTLLKRHREQIEWVHERVAAGLQMQSEHTGEAYSSLPDAEITTLFREKLTENGFLDAEVEKLSSDLDKATKQRLVLLIPRVHDQISFEVRSLQEYMAARWIASGDLETVLGRLRALAPSAYWRNTWLLAAGRLYSLRPQDRDTFLERLRQWDNESVEAAFIGRGSRMALELLRDDFASSIPLHYRSLLELAMTSLSRWLGPDWKRLSMIAREAVNGNDHMARQIVLSRLEEGVSSGSRAHLGAIAILRDWKGDSGRSGAFARKQLQLVHWRPETEDERLLSRPTSPVGEALEEHLDLAELTDAERTLWLDAANEMSSIHVKRDVTPAETIAITQRSLPSRVLSASAFENPTVQRLMIKAANQVPISGAPAAIVARRLICAADESAPRGVEADLLSH